jgi:hypothetical protein
VAKSNCSADGLRRLAESHVVGQEQATVCDESLDALELVGVELPAEAIELPEQARCFRAATSHSRAALELLGNERSHGRIDRHSAGRIGHEPGEVFKQTMSVLRVEQKLFWEGPDLRLGARTLTRCSRNPRPLGRDADLDVEALDPGGA